MSDLTDRPSSHVVMIDKCLRPYRPVGLSDLRRQQGDRFEHGVGATGGKGWGGPGREGVRFNDIKISSKFW